MSVFGATPISITILGTNAFPVSAVAVPGTANGDLTALEGGPVSTDSNNNKTAPMSVYVKDGSDTTLGASGDTANANTVMGQLKQIQSNTASVTITTLPSLPAGTNTLGNTFLVDSAGTNLAGVDSSHNVLVKVNAALPAGTNVIGHAIIDSGSTTAVTQATGSNLHAVLDAGSAVIGHVIADSGSTTAVTGTVAVTESGAWGVNISDGAGNALTSNSTTYTAKKALDSNILGTLGTAFSTAGKVDVKGADGDVFVRQTTGSNLHVVLDTTSTTAVTQATAANLNATVVSGNATGSAVPANAYYAASLAKTSLPTAASDGNLTGAMSDKFGRLVALTNAMRDLVGSATITLSSTTTETTLVGATASVFHDLTAVTVSNTSATAARVDFRDNTGGSVIFPLYVPAGDVRGIVFQVPQPQTSVNTNWSAQSSASVADLRIFAQFISNK
jgi:hypothetical protein